MAIDTIIGYDATGGGVLAILTPGMSLTTKSDGSLIGYFYDGISAEEVTVTCAGDEDWPAAGVSLPATSDGTAVGAGKTWVPMDFEIPVKANKTFVMTGSSGANPAHGGLLIDYPALGPIGGANPYKVRSALNPKKGYLWTRGTTAGGTNCAAGTIVQGATNLTGWGNHTWTPVALNANGAFTTTAFVGFKKAGGPNLLPMFPIGLTDVANDMRATQFSNLPEGLGQTYTGNDVMELFFSSATAEQPTANITFARLA